MENHIIMYYICIIYVLNNITDILNSIIRSRICFVKRIAGRLHR